MNFDSKVLRLSAMLVTACILACPAVAQEQAVVTIPPNIVVPNYDSVATGPYGGLEGGAYVARTSDPSAAWFNPAGLSRSTGSQITGSAGIYQLTNVSPDSFSDDGGSVQHLPNLVGFTVQRDKLTLGVAFVTRLSWEQDTDAQQIQSAAGLPAQRFAFSADASLTERVAAFSAGYDNGRSWRLGGGLAFSYTSIRSVGTVSHRIAEATDLQTLLVSSRATGSTVQLRPVFGVSIQPSARVRIGGLLRTSGFAIFTNGSTTLDGTLSSGTLSLGASFFDPGIDFKYDLPWEAVGGVAFVGERAEVEVDIKTYSSISPYKMFSSAENILTYRDPGNGTAPVVSSQPFPGLTTASRAIANVSVGGHFQFRRERPLRLHYGVASDLSPVTPEDQLFDHVDFVTGTIGLSGTVGKLTFSAGVNYHSGTADDLVVRNVLTGEFVQTAVTIRSLGMLYSLAYQF